MPAARAMLYSPYDTPPGSSLQFVAQQIARATVALYGTAIPADEIATRYLETRPDGSVAPKSGGLRLRADYPQLQPRSAGPLLPFFVTLVAVPWLVLVAGLFRTYRPDIGEARGQQFVWGFIIVFLAVFIGLFALTISSAVHAWAPRAVLGIAARGAGDRRPPDGCHTGGRHDRMGGHDRPDWVRVRARQRGSSAAWRFRHGRGASRSSAGRGRRSDPRAA